MEKKNDSSDLAGKRIAFYGEFASWPKYHGGTPKDIATWSGAITCKDVDDSLDILVIGDKREKGRANAIRKAEKINSSGKNCINILDEAAFRDLVRQDVSNMHFAFCGGFDCCPNDFDSELLGKMVEAVGATVQLDINESLNYLVVGNRRAKGKTAAIRKADKLRESGVPLAVVDEDGFLELVRRESANENEEMTFPTFVSNLYGAVDERRIQRAMKMLQTERFQLYSVIDPEHLIGVVKSQTRSNTVYAPYLESSGRYGCLTTELEECMGLQGSPCKHLLVLLIGLVRTGEISIEQGWRWIRATSRKSPKRDDEFAAKALLQYKGAQAGEVDWRPTETIPEDYYTL